MQWKILRSNTAGGAASRRHSFFDQQGVADSEEKNEEKLDETTSEDYSRTENLAPRSFLDPSPGQGRSTTGLTGQATSHQLASRDGQHMPRSHRFGLLKLRHASDPQLSKSYATSAPSSTPPLPTPPTPTIVTTAPNAPPPGQNGNLMDRLKLPGRAQSSSKETLPLRRQSSKVASGRASESSSRPSLPGAREAATNQRVTFEAPNRFSTLFARGSPPAYADVPNTSLALPPPRLSESSKSDGSSGENGIYAETTTTHTVSTTTTFFRLPRRKKEKGHLFPLPVKIPPPDSNTDALKPSKPSPSGRMSLSPARQSTRTRAAATTDSAPEMRPNFGSEHPSPMPSPTHSSLSITNAASRFPGVYRRDSITSYRSANSSTSAPTQRPILDSRGRSSTAASLKRPQERERQDSPHLVPTGRTSTSTAGRKSFGDIFSLSQRFRQNSEPANLGNGKMSSGTPGTPASTNSKANSFQMHREPVAYPERAEGDTPATYLAKLEEAVNRGVIAAILCKHSDDFSKTCLRKYMRGFSYFGDSIDMAVRKMLMEVELPKETQQIDRLLQGFADRYCECNPGIFVSTDEAYFVAFSILLLHSDTHNKNNKRKMQKADYVKNTQDQVEVSHEILGCFYDNVSYTPFVHFEDEVATNSHRLAAPKPKKGLFKAASTDNLRSPVDPYALILDQKLELLRPSLREVMNTEDTYSCTGTASSWDANGLYEAFHKAGVLQIVSARSRPDAFLSQATISNPSEAQVGLVDIKAAKVGLLWRKDPRKKKTRSPWQEWGALLTGSQLYFFRDVAWVKSLMSQHEAQLKSNSDGAAVVFKPPLTSFQPDALLSMDDVVALLDAGYRKHKNAFLFVKHGGFEEVFLANNEEEMNDWIAKLNYAATFRTAGVRMRGFIGANYEGQRPEVGRHHSSTSARSFRSNRASTQPLGRQINQQLAGEILAYRRQIMSDRIAEADGKLATTEKELDNLLRNARHLQICSPIQSKTREALVFAAGRMSAKLKWTRVEMWRTKGHRDIMKMDLEQELACRPAPPTFHDSLSIKPTSQQKTPSRSSNQASKKSEARGADPAASPKSTQSAFSSTSMAHSLADTARNGEVMPPASPPSAEGSDLHPPLLFNEEAVAADEITAEPRERMTSVSAKSPITRPLYHQPSLSSSVLVRSDADSIGRGSGLATPGPSIDGEERLLREAGLIDAGQQTARPPRWPDTSESDLDANPTASSDPSSKELVGARRSLQRTLRDAPHSPQASQSLRQRKGKDAALHRSPAASLRRGSQTSGEGLARKASSFTLHGKKASVVTLGSEWQSMTAEERLKLRKPEQSEKETSEGAAGAAGGVGGAGTGDTGETGDAGDASDDESAQTDVRLDDGGESVYEVKAQSPDDVAVEVDMEDCAAARADGNHVDIGSETALVGGLATPDSEHQDERTTGSRRHDADIEDVSVVQDHDLGIVSVDLQRTRSPQPVQA